MLPARIAIAACAAAAAIAAMALSGCTSATAGNSSTSASSSAASAAPSGVAPSSATSTPTAAATLSPGGTATQNKAYFSLVTERLLASNKTPTGREFIDNLVDAGFDKAKMQVTPDKTAIGLTADAIEFSVQFGSECLVGQKGEAFGFTAIVLPTLDTGTCLVGKTRTIDW